MNQQKNIQIPADLFFSLCRYHLTGDTQDSDAIRRALESKLDSLVNRQLYNTYKTATTPQEREAARQQYLDRKNIPMDFRS